MIVVTVELWPFGMRSERRTIGKAIIANDRTGDAEYGNYRATVYKEDESELCPEVVVRDHYRRFGVWRLIQRVLENVDFKVSSSENAVRT